MRMRWYRYLAWGWMASVLCVTSTPAAVMSTQAGAWAGEEGEHQYNPSTPSTTLSFANAVAAALASATASGRDLTSYSRAESISAFGDASASSTAIQYFQLEVVESGEPIGFWWHISGTLTTYCPESTGSQYTMPEASYGISVLNGLTNLEQRDNNFVQSYYTTDVQVREIDEYEYFHFRGQTFDAGTVLEVAVSLQTDAGFGDFPWAYDGSYAEADLGNSFDFYQYDNLINVTVPEPHTIGFLALGMAVVVCARRRRCGA